MNEQLIKQIILTEIGNEETLVALEKSIVPEEIEWLKGELVRDKEIVEKWIKNNGITQEEILAVRNNILLEALADTYIEETDMVREGLEDRNEAILRLNNKPYTWLQ